MRMIMLGLAVICTQGLSAVQATAAEPVALIESAPETRSDIVFMDFVYPDAQIKLGATETLVLGYITSCIRETITGGTVTVGAKQSTIQGGLVKRETVVCDAQVMDVAANTAGEAGVAVFRGVAPDTGKTIDKVTGKPRITVLNDLVPIIKLRSPKGVQTVIITKLGTVEGFSVPVEGRGVIDLAKHGIELEPGAKYVVGTEQHSLVIEVSDFAGTGSGPMERLIVL